MATSGKTQPTTGGSDAAVPSVPRSRIQFPTPSAFNFKSDEWKEWRQRFERFMRSTDLKDQNDSEKVNALVYLMGPQAEKIFASFNLTEKQQEDYQLVLNKFNSHFTPTKNVIYESYRFHTRKQGDGEPVDDFITDLHHLAANCDFPATYVKRAIRDQIVVGICDKTLSEKLQMNADLTLEDAIIAARQHETIKKQQEAFRSSPDHIASTNRVSANKYRGKNSFMSSRFNETANKSQQNARYLHNNGKSCQWCGLAELHERNKCPARNAICIGCHKKGHYKKVCIFRKTVNLVGDETIVNQSSDSEEEGFIGLTEATNTDTKSRWLAQIKLCDVLLQSRPDTGADVSVLPSDTYHKKFGGKPLLKNDRLLTGADGKELDCLGRIYGSVTYKTHTAMAYFYVISGAKQVLLSHKLSEQLNILKRVSTIQSKPFDPIASFPSLFRGLGNTKQPYHIQLVDNAVPYSLNTPRRVPLPLKPALRKELNHLLKTGIIKEVKGPTLWCAPIVIVPKKNQKIRLCVDLTNLNKYIRREIFQMPSIDYTLGQLEGAKYFTQLDANNGFWQIPLSEESMELTTFITPFGRFCFTRLPFGATSAPEVFQKQLNVSLEGLENVVIHYDNIVVFGNTKEEHDKNLQKVLSRLHKHGWTLNEEKCEFGKEKIELLGHIVSKDGVAPNPKKINAILAFPAPSDVTELKRFLGLCSFLSKFLPHFATIARPLNDLLSSNAEWVWGHPQQAAFQDLKNALTSAPCLALYNSNRKTIISADASSFGLGAVLLQVQEDGSKRPVAYASRTLNPAEAKWAQIEKEALALAWACERFADFIWGLQITLETDHKPLVTILGGTKDLDSLTPRLQRIRLRLLRYCYEIIHIPGKHLAIADALSRAPFETASNQELTEEVAAYVQLIVSSLPASDAKLAEIATNLTRDPACHFLIQYCTVGWPEKSKLPEPCFPYWQHRFEISLQNGLLLKGKRLIIPMNMRKEMIDKLHEGHQGISKCRALAKQSTYLVAWIVNSTPVPR